MSIRIPNHVVNFAGNANLPVYEGFGDYWNHYLTNIGFTNKEHNTSISFSEKEDRLNAALKKEIMRVAGITDFSQFPLETWASHPNLRWAEMAVVSALVEMILPQTLDDTIGMYTDIRNVGYGDSLSVDVKPRDLFVVSKAGFGKRTAELKKQFIGQQTLVPEPRQISAAVSFYKVLAGKESLADYVVKLIRSVETELRYDVYSVFATAMAAISNTASTGLRVAGYSQTEFTRLAQTVQAWNGNSPVMAIGTKRALASVIPFDPNYRYDIASDFVKLGHVREFAGVNIFELPQIADYTTPFALKLSDTTIWFISGSTDKLVKLAIEGANIAYTDEPFRNANLMQTTTMIKSWKAGVITSSVGGTMTL